jgi:hypothetical protein
LARENLELEAAVSPGDDIWLAGGGNTHGYAGERPAAGIDDVPAHTYDLAPKL